MSDNQPHGASSLPFRTLGYRLKTMREHLKQSLGEVSGAVEIDVSRLDKFERGLERPSEDILVLLINHFGVRSSEASQLWAMAGYDKDEDEKASANLSGKQLIMLMSLNMPAAYSDGVEIIANQAGLTMHFMQATGQVQQPQMPVGKVGMSYEQAERVLKALQQTLLQAKYGRGPKSLPPPTNKANSNKKNRQND